MQSGDQYLDHETQGVSSSLHHASAFENQRMIAPATGSLADEYPSDPHDFYRQYSSQTDNRPDIVVGSSASTMASAQQRSRARINGLNPVPTSSFDATRSPLRSASEPHSTSPVALGAAASFPPVSVASRSQRPSVKDRINQLQQRAASNTGPANVRSSKTRPSVATASEVPSGSRSSSAASMEVRAAPVQHPQIVNHSHHSATGSTNSPYEGRRQPSSTSVRSEAQPAAGVSGPLRGDNSGPPLLFGEVDRFDSRDVGYGIPNLTQQRRGSEGSMHQPNAMFSSSNGVSELEDIHTFSGLYSLTPAQPPRPASAQGHRRIRSDNASATSFRNRNQSMSRIDAEFVHHVKPPASPNTQGQRSPSSKIPVRSRGLSFASATSPSLHSWTGSVADEQSFASSSSPAGRGLSPLKGPAGNENVPQKRPVTPPLTLSAKRYEPTTSKPVSSNQSLKAIITAPIPKKSPPLRSSRPRQPVSAASTVASRSRATERSASPSQRGSAVQDTFSIRNNAPKPRWISDFGTVNVAARTAQLQSAMKSTRSGSTEPKLPTEGSNLDLSRMGIVEEPLKTSSERPHQTTVADEKGLSPNKDGLASAAPRLALDVSDLPVSDGLEPSSGVTVFGTDESPVLGLASPFRPAATPLSQAVEYRHDNAPAADLGLGAAAAPATLQEAVYDTRVQPLKGLGAGLGAIVSIMRARSTSSASRAGPVEDALSDRDDGESIQIGLGTTPVEPQEPWQSREHDDSAPPPDHNVEKRFTNGSFDSSTSEASPVDLGAEPFPDHSEARSSLVPDDSVSVAYGNRSFEQTPDTPHAPRKRHYTLNSEARSVVNKVLDQYHSGHVTPEMAHEFQQQIEAMTPELTRHGGWDSVAATQAYLQTLLDAEFLSQDMPTQASSQATEPTEIHPDPYDLAHDSPEDEDYHGTAIIYSMPEAYGYDTVADVNVDVIEAQHGHSTSTSTLRTARPDSDSGFMDEDYRPTPPPKDWKYSPRPSDVGIATSQAGPAEGGSTSKVEEEVQSRLAGIEGTGGVLGLAIHTPSLQAAPVLLTPPLPTHSPPPPPATQMAGRSSQGPSEIRSPPSPSVYSTNPPSSIFQHALPGSAADQVQPHHTTRAANDRGTAVDVSGHTSAGAEVDTNDPADNHLDALERHPSPASLAQQKLNKDLVERKNVIRELVDTEYSFGVDMTVLEDIYKATSVDISSLGDILSDDDRRLVFGNSEQIKILSRDFLNDLKKGAAPVYKIPRSNRWGFNKRESSAMSQSVITEQPLANSIELSDKERYEQDRETRIGEKFRRSLARMEKIYGDYIKSRDAGNQRLAMLMQQPNVQLWLDECRLTARDLTGAWNLDAILVKPTQRIMKYPLLLDNLLKCTPPDHPDYDDLKFCAEEIKRVNERINEMKKRHEIVDQFFARKRKDSEPNKMQLPKLLNRRTDKLRQQVGLFNAAEDQEYEAIAQKFGGHFFQLQIVMRDVEKYVEEVQNSVDSYHRLVLALVEIMEVEKRSDYTQVFSTWSKYAQHIREITDVMLPDHVSHPVFVGGGSADKGAGCINPQEGHPAYHVVMEIA